ncbi:MAG: PDZ domain-containing protein [Cyanobacteria bacterium P01_H01_bin.119]
MSIDGEAIASADVLQRRVENSQVGQTLQLKVKRGSETQQLDVITAELENRE